MLIILSQETSQRGLTFEQCRWVQTWLHRSSTGAALTTLHWCKGCSCPGHMSHTCWHRSTGEQENNKNISTWPHSQAVLLWCWDHILNILNYNTMLALKPWQHFENIQTTWLWYMIGHTDIKFCFRTLISIVEMFIQLMFEFIWFRYCWRLEVP